MAYIWIVRLITKASFFKHDCDSSNQLQPTLEVPQTPTSSFSNLVVCPLRTIADPWAISNAEPQNPQSEGYVNLLPDSYGTSRSIFPFQPQLLLWTLMTKSPDLTRLVLTFSNTPF